MGSQINGALILPFIAKTDLLRAHAQRSTSAVTKFSLSSTLVGAIFPPIFTKFGTRIAHVIFKAELVCDRKREYFARMRGSRISVFLRHFQ